MQSRPAYFHDHAKVDMSEACVYCERKQKGLGKKFRIAVGEAIDRIIAMPEAHAKIWNEMRRVRVEGIKDYVIHYLVSATKSRLFLCFTQVARQGSGRRGFDDVGRRSFK
ncbi:MAG: hypothetical protein EXS09_10230 [Gemmataceae bacterium]|nr:hypothetical protein [Gemmataceae bacterium]